MSIQRMGAIAGMVGVGLALVGGFAQGMSIPEVDAPADEIVGFFADKEGVLRWALPLLLLSTTAFGFFVVGLFDRMRAGGAGGWAYAVLLGGAGSAVMVAVTVVPLGVAPLGPGGGLSDAQIVSLWGLQSAFYGAGPALDTIMLLGVAIPAVAPSWLRAYSGLLAILAVISVFGVANPAIGAIGLIYSLLVFVWIVAGSAWLFAVATAPAMREAAVGSA